MITYELQYRPAPVAGTLVVPEEDADALDWRPAGSFDETTQSLEIVGLVPGLRYDVRVRSVEGGKASPWQYRYAVLVTVDEIRPPAPRLVHLTKRDCISWEWATVSREVRGVLVRHVPDFVAAVHWDLFEPAHLEPVPTPPFLLCRVPRGRRTFAVKSVDQDGNTSETATLVTIDRGPIDARARFTMRTRDEHALGFPSTAKQGGTVDGAGDLVANADGVPLTVWPSQLVPAWSKASGVPAWNGEDEPAWGAPHGRAIPYWAGDSTALAWSNPWFRWVEYSWTFTVHHREAGPGSALTMDVDCVGWPWRVLYRKRGHLPHWDENGKAAAWSGSSSSAYWSDQVGGWRPWPGCVDDVSAGVYEFRVLVPCGRGDRRGRITRLSVSVSAAGAFEDTTGLQVPAGGQTRVPVVGTYGHVRAVDPVLVYSGGAGVEVAVVDHRETGPAIVVLDKDGNPVAGVVNVSLGGFGSMSLPAALAITGAVDEGTLQTLLENHVEVTRVMLGGAAKSELTIAGGAVTATRALHSIDTQGDASTDELDTIDVSALEDGGLLVVCAEDASRVPTLKHNNGADGTMLMRDSADVAIDAAAQFVAFVIDKSGSPIVLRELFRTGFDFRSTVAPKSTSYTAKAYESGKTFSNAAAGGAVAINLPPAVVGLEFSAYVSDAQPLQLVPNGSDTIRNAGTSSGTGWEASTVGNFATIVCVAAGAWAFKSAIGTWTAV